MIYTLSKVAYLLIFPMFMRRDAYQLFTHNFLLHSTLHKSWSFYHFKVELKPVIAWKMDSLAKNPFPFTKGSSWIFCSIKRWIMGMSRSRKPN